MRRYTFLLLPTIGFALLTLLVAWLGRMHVIDAGFAQIAVFALPGIAVAMLYSRRPGRCPATGRS